jgi:hypothetical protein
VFKRRETLGGAKSRNHQSASADDFGVRTIEEPGPELDALARETIGTAIEVHRALGPGFLESIYEEALCLELTHRSISFARQVPIPICYRSRPARQPLGLLLNFHVPVLQAGIKRVVLSAKGAPAHTHR